MGDIARHVEAARAHFENSEYAAVLGECEHALLVAPNNVTALLLCARAYYEMGMDSAERYFETALSVEPNNVEVLKSYAKFLLDGDSSKSERLYRRALSRASNDGWVHVGLALALTGNDKRLAALTHFEFAMRLLGDLSELRRQYDELLTETEELRRDLKDVEAAMRRNPFPDVILLLGAAYSKEGLYDRAMKILSEGCSMFPDNGNLKLALEHTQQTSAELG